MNRIQNQKANIRLHIDRLVLDGFNLNLRERQQLQTSIETELTRLLGEHGLHHELTRGLAIPKLVATPIKPGEQASNQPQQLGQQIAASVYGGIGHGPGKP